MSLDGEAYLRKIANYWAVKFISNQAERRQVSRETGFASGFILIGWKSSSAKCFVTS